MKKLILPLMMALIIMLPMGAKSQSGVENYVSASGCVIYHAPVYYTGNDGYAFDFEADYDAEHLLNCTVMDADGDGHNWRLSPVGEGFGHNGSNGVLMSYSYNNATQTALSPNNYLVLPQIAITSSNKVLTFFACALDEANPSDHFGVAVSTSSNDNPSAFTMMQDWTMTPGSWHQYTVNLNSYVGQSVYIAIRHFNSADNFCLCVDDIVLNAGNLDPLTACSITSDGSVESVEPMGRYHFLNTDGFASGSNHSTTVQATYQSGASMQSQYSWTFRSGEEFLGSPTGLQALSDGNQVNLSWTLPEMTGPGSVGDLYYDFSDSTFSNLTLIDANNDGLNWVVYPYYGNGGGMCIKSNSWQGDQINVDNFLVTPKVTATAESSITFMARDSDMPGLAPDPEHFGIAVSTAGNTNASDFAMVQEWNSTGTYTQYTADLSAYAGQEIYVALRHFNTTGSTYYLIVDDIHLTGIEGDVPQNAIGVNIYSNDELVAMLNHGETSFTHGVNRYNSEYCIRVIQNGNMETGNYYALAAPQCATVDLTCVAPKNLSGQVNNGVVSLSWERELYTGFEEDPQGWTFLDGDGDGQVFGIYNGGGMNSDGSVNTTNTNPSLSSFSYLNGLGALTPDNYAFMPMVRILEGAHISFYAAGYDPSYPSEHFGVVVANGDGTNITTIAEWNSSNPYSLYTVDLSNYAGQDMFVGFRHFTTTSNYALVIDNITLTNAVWAGTSSYTSQYNIYSSPDNTNYSLIGSVDGDHTSFQMGTKSVSAYYRVTALNTIAGGETCESDPAMSVDGIHNYVQLTVEGDYAITASANPVQGGEIQGAGFYESGETCNLLATANPGYEFESWTRNGDVVSTNPSYSFTVTGNASFVANFSHQAVTTYVITVSADPIEGGVVSGGNTYAEGSVCRLEAMANPDYRFVNWTKNGQVVSTSAIFSFNVVEDAAYVAHFQNTVGVDDQQMSKVTVFPNPANDRLTVEAGKVIKQCDVYSVTGALVVSQQGDRDKMEINVSTLPAGFYLIRMSFDDAIETRSFVKK